jgi:hypothetical protein
MAVMHCPHCGAENFTMEGWEDLDHCSSCGKPLGDPARTPLDATVNGHRRAGQHQGGKGQGTRRPRPA